MEWLAPGSVVSQGAPLLAKSLESHRTPVAPVDGIVGEQVPVRLIGGREVLGVRFTPAHPGPTVRPNASRGDHREAARRLDEVDTSAFGEWLTRIQLAGIAADRWTCPDLLKQLRDALTRPIDTLVCNLLDSDPWLPLSRTACQSYPRELAAGLGLLGRLTGAKDWWALVDQADDCSGPIREAASDLASALRIAPLENDYPQLDPTLLVHSITGRRLRPGRLPSTHGVILIDGPAAAAIGRLLLDDSPMTHVPIAVYDQPTDVISCLSVPLGVHARAVFSLLGIPWASRDVFAGGPLRQLRVGDDEVIGPGELTLFSAPQHPAMPPEPCVRCGWCVEACPTRCRPAGLLEAAQRRDAEWARGNGLDACIECGLCTFVCPSKLPLLEGIRFLKRGIAAEEF
ncbi:4Fe-4S dicluster domain-containing protein [Humisphaera borealis]|uniref:4Fe-4S dicluster domain-containing protein n=1 Tax=Humisphaera borealis TaxID=2807512 RepID=A0A7M2X063_9BACT|nr:4Fe-4S dicluster domain-containing protein [Humisphaera borealis]QOV91146.1 4Fe-4S dicluster domain-containing protein [Humisphaera borealis]